MQICMFSLLIRWLSLQWELQDPSQPGASCHLNKIVALHSHHLPATRGLQNDGG